MGGKTMRPLISICMILLPEKLLYIVRKMSLGTKMFRVFICIMFSNIILRLLEFNNIILSILEFNKIILKPLEFSIRSREILNISRESRLKIICLSWNLKIALEIVSTPILLRVGLELRHKGDMKDMKERNEIRRKDWYTKRQMTLHRDQSTCKVFSESQRDI